ncbi:MAG TPA: hypothetical protein VER58_05705 [Thermoanaerobaculia bacterium]|nr:hypothetical protein [Thermoanaerobaculia bacterium]
MRKITTKQFVAATTLALTFAAFGCTTNHYRGSGEPTKTTPGYGATNQSVTPGSSYGTAGIPPMASSYTGIARPNTDALAIAAADQGFRGRVLGPANPGGVQLSVPDYVTGQVMTPAGQQQTINPSIYSPGVAGITGGVGGGVASTAVISGSGVTTAAGSPLVVTGAIGVGATPAAGAIVPTSNATTPSISGNALFAPQVSNGVVTSTSQTASGSTTTTSPMSVTGAIGVGATPASGTILTSTTATSPTISGSSVFRPAISRAVVTGTTRSALPSRLATTRAAVSKATASRAAIMASRDVAVAPIMISTNTSGHIVVSNVNTATSTHANH